MGHEEPAWPHGEDAGRARQRDDSVEPFFAGLSGAHAAGDEASRALGPDDLAAQERGEPGDDDGPPPDPWRRAGRAHGHAPGHAHGHGRAEADATDEDPGFDENRIGAGLVIKALLLMAALVLVSAAIYFVFGA